MPEQSQTRLEEHCKAMWEFEPAPGKSKQGAGAASGGRDFEALVRSFWDAIGECAQAVGARCTYLPGVDKPKCYHLAHCQIDHRILVLPSARKTGATFPTKIGYEWLRHIFKIIELVQKYPGTDEAIQRYAPDDGPFAYARYPEMYGSITTEYDGAVLLISEDMLYEKILIECKSAKRDDRYPDKLVGNVHERLSYQTMQYLEIATRYPRCSLVAISNGAYVRYHNKYHVGLRIQADRLSNFAWFSMDQISTTTEYLRFAQGLLEWLQNGTPRNNGKQCP